jgi:hypothetical protein
MIAYGDFTETWSAALLFNGSELFVGGALNGGVYPATEVDASHPLDSVNQYFPPSALQNPSTLSQSARANARAHFQLKSSPKEGRRCEQISSLAKDSVEGCAGDDLF